MSMTKKEVELVGTKASSVVEPVVINSPKEALRTGQTYDSFVQN